MRLLYLAIPVAFAAMLAACGGGGSNSAIPTAPTSAPSTGTSPSSTQTIKFVLAIPLPTTTPAARHRNFVSSATNGASIAVTGPGGASAQAVVNLSSGSSACTTSGTLRTCTVNITVPIGLDTFTITTYDTAPVNGVIPATAHELGIGSATATVSPGTPSVSISISGLIANLGTLPGFSSLPADGATHQVPIILAPTDFGNQPIVAGTSDPYANPITVTLTESGGSGHASLIFDGGSTGVTSATLAHSTDTVTLQYDGGGAPGYSITITASANGVSSTSTTIGPLYAAASGLVANTLTLTSPGTPVTVTLSEAGAPGTQQYSAGISSGCTNVATATPVNGTGPSATFTVSGGTTPSQDVCSILLSDGTIFLNLAITNSPNGVTPSPTPTPTATPTPTPTPTATPTPASGSGSVTINGYAFSTQAISPVLTPTQIVAGPDGNMWFGSLSGAYGFTNASAGSATGVSFSPVTALNTPSLTVASDGNVYFADSSDGVVVLVNPSDGGLQAALDGPQAMDPTAIVGAPDGNIYFADIASDAIWKISVAGQFTEYDAGGHSYSQMTVGPDGNLWMVDSSGGVEQFVLATQAISTVSGISGATSIAAGSDGNLYVTTTGSSIIRFAPGSPGTQTSLANGTTNGAQGIAGGVDGAMWYAVPASNAVVRLVMSTHATTVFSLSPSVPYDIAIGHDGSIWFTDQTNYQIGHLAP